MEYVYNKHIWGSKIWKIIFWRMVYIYHIYNNCFIIKTLLCSFRYYYIYVESEKSILLGYAQEHFLGMTFTILVFQS